MDHTRRTHLSPGRFPNRNNASLNRGKFIVRRMLYVRRFDSDSFNSKSHSPCCIPLEIPATEIHRQRVRVRKVLIF